LCLFEISDLWPTADNLRKTTQLASQPSLRLKTIEEIIDSWGREN
jgi:hypothetical protein